jgi:IS1 family transposase
MDSFFPTRPVMRHPDETISANAVTEIAQNNIACMKSNKLASEKRAQILSLLVEGNSLPTASRYSDTPLSACQKLLADVGTALSAYQDCTLRNRTWKRIQIDEVWSFVYAKRSRISTAKRQDPIHGDAWTWIATDDDTKFVISWLVGGRDVGYAIAFVDALRSRLANRGRLASDGRRVYLKAGEGAFDHDMDYARLVERYGVVPDDDKVRSEGHSTTIRTGYGERRNAAIRIGFRRFASLTNAFSKKVESHAHAVALHYVHYNFCRIHKKLRETPAIAAGLADRLWGINDILRVLEDWEAGVAG